MSGAPLVSIVIPTRNGGPPLAAAVRRHRLAADRLSDRGGRRRLGLVRWDDRFCGGSRENADPDRPALVRSRRHRNLYAVSKARGTFVVLMVQDAVPVDDRWLAALVDPLRGDPSHRRQLRAAECPPKTHRHSRHYLARWIAAGSDPRAVFVRSETEFAALSPIEALRAIGHRQRLRGDSASPCGPQFHFGRRRSPKTSSGDGRRSSPVMASRTSPTPSSSTRTTDLPGTS